jgi:DNA-binding NtrC family response regulator
MAGNIRELENMLERAVIVASGEMLTLQDLPADLGASVPSARKPPG